MPAFDLEKSLDVTKDVQKYVDLVGSGRMFDWSKLEHDMTALSFCWGQRIALHQTPKSACL